MKHVLGVLLAAGVVAGLGASLVHHHPARGHAGVEVTIPNGHVHDAHCGHNWHDGRWFHQSGHRHGPGCGHHLLHGRWTLELVP